MRNMLLVIVCGCRSDAASALGRGRAKPRRRRPAPAVVQSLLACRALTDSAARLACYDEAAAGVAQAIAPRTWC